MESNDLVKQLLDTTPLPAFVAREDGSIVRANAALLEVAGQPQLVSMERSLFGLGIFHNVAELRGFLTSFRGQVGPRRLALPTGRLSSSAAPIILYATRIAYEDQPALYGVLLRSQHEASLLQSGERLVASLLDRLPLAALTLDNKGLIKFINASMRVELTMANRADPQHLLEIDAETDQASLVRHIRQATQRGLAVYETTLQRGNNTLYPVECTLTPLRHAAVSGEYLLTVADITQRRSARRQIETLEAENEKLTRQLQRRSVLVSERYDSQDEAYRIITQSPAYQSSVLRKIEQVAPTDSTVLITGETGTGKELIARAIHHQSRRADRPMVILNCGALPAELIESELFGYRKGAFTGARQDHLGRFELADEGTLFLDEIGEMPLQLQTRLLRVLQDGEFTPLGARQAVHTDVRILAATNRNLRSQVTEGSFRADLYFRLNVFPIHSLPLRERLEDIPLLAEHFIRKYSPDGTSPPKLRDADIAWLQQQAFPGNIRELENLIQRALITSTGSYLQLDADRRTMAREERLQKEENGQLPAPRKELDNVVNVLTFDEAQRQHIERVLTITQGKVSGPGGAAELLGLKAQTLFSKMRKLGVSRSQ